MMDPQDCPAGTICGGDAASHPCSDKTGDDLIKCTEENPPPSGTAAGMALGTSAMCDGVLARRQVLREMMVKGMSGLLRISAIAVSYHELPTSASNSKNVVYPIHTRQVW